METSKKILLSIFIVCLVIGGVSGSLYLFKKYSTKKEVAFGPTLTTAASTSPEAVIPGYKQDVSMKIPEALPGGLVSNNDIVFILTSFNVIQDGKHQYTFKYQSKKTIPEATSYFMAYLKGLRWQIMGKPEISQTSAFISARQGANEQVFITMSDLNGTIVDITYIK